MKVSLKALRANANLTQKAAAKQIGVAQKTIQNWEYERSFPDVPTLLKICEIYNCTFDDIYIPDKLAKS